MDAQAVIKHSILHKYLCSTSADLVDMDLNVGNNGGGFMFADLVSLALEEFARNVGEGRIPRALTHHPSADSVKPLAHEEYDDRGNWTGSVVMLLLLFPDTYVPDKFQTHINVPPAMLWLNGAGDREPVLRNVGMPKQPSGKKQDNYRTNLLEAIIGNLDKDYPGCDYARHLKALWTHVSVHMNHNWDAVQDMDIVE